MEAYFHRNQVLQIRPDILAIDAAIKFLEHMLEDIDFVIKTDLKPLTYAFTQN
jgi:hypothetical protein